MVLADNLPSDSVLRRHALTEMNRVLGLPPTDAVLRRHYDHLQSTLQAGGPAASAAPAAARSAAGPQAAAARPQPSAAPMQAAPAAAPVHAPVSAPAQGGGLLGWLKRLFGG